MGNGTGNTGYIMLRAGQFSSLHPVLVSETEAESHSSFQQEPPTGWGIAFKEFKCVAAHKAFLYRSGVRTSPACWLQCVVLGREIVPQRFSSAVGSTAQCVKWVQTFYILTHELCWVPCEGVNAMCCIQVPYHMYLEHLINLIRTNGAYIQSSVIYKY